MARIATIAVICALHAHAIPARAQPTEGGDEVARRRALDLLDESAVLYRDGRFAEAAEKLRTAHGLFPEPSLLYNLGRALDAMGDRNGAIDAYERYLEADPASTRRGEVSARVEALRRDRPQASGLGPQQPSLVGPAIVLVGGVAIVGAGVVLGLMAQSRLDEAREASNAESFVLEEEAHDLATVANVLFVAGGVVAAAGLTWLLLSIGGDDETTVSIGPGTVALRGHF